MGKVIYDSDLQRPKNVAHGPLKTTDVGPTINSKSPESTFDSKEVPVEEDRNLYLCNCRIKIISKPPERGIPITAARALFLRFITRQPRSLLLPFPQPAGLSTAAVNLSSSQLSRRPLRYSRSLSALSRQPAPSATAHRTHPQCLLELCLWFALPASLYWNYNTTSKIKYKDFKKKEIVPSASFLEKQYDKGVDDIEIQDNGDGGAYGYPPNPAEMFYETRKKRDKLIDEDSIKKHDELVAATSAQPNASYMEIVEHCFGPCIHSHITCYGGGVKKKMQQNSEKKNLFEENLQFKKEIMEMKADITALKELDINALKGLIMQTIKENAAKN
ncbi:hypothetical protein AXF42_Ash008852 [Apostasia shenzhenica]|uniref:Uncharacterized protein n=1 Tax=Apostasia shenzhenica TaxID=1088818 RepID=A0A2I0ASP6_9ASPA|nr:hypothetical protein AXF42_Ash008852 [Apostasia shenzhenica]